MSRVFSAGWENRCRHPQLVDFYEVYVQTELEYPANGVEGLGYMRLNWDQKSANRELEHAAIYQLYSDDDKIFLNADIMSDWILTIPWLSEEDWLIKIWWDNSAVSDPGYVYFDMFHNEVGWNWSGHSAAYPRILNHQLWYNIDLHVQVNPGGADRIRLLIEGFEVFDDSIDVTASFNTINQVWLGHREYMVFLALATGYGRISYDNVKVNVDDGVGVAADNTYPWHIVFIGLPVIGPGVHTELTPYPTPPNWDNVDELPPDDVDLNQSGLSGELDTYIFTNCPTYVLNVSDWIARRFILRNRHRVSEPSGEGWYPIVRMPNGIDYRGAKEVSGSGFHCFEEIWDVRPDTGADWAKAIIDDPGMEVGAETIT